LEDAPGEKTLEVYHGSPTGVGKIATRKRRILMIISSKWSSKKWGDLPNKSLLSLYFFVYAYTVYTTVFAGQSAVSGWWFQSPAKKCWDSSSQTKWKINENMSSPGSLNFGLITIQSQFFAGRISTFSGSKSDSSRRENNLEAACRRCLQPWLRR
jgi:hypothetical protein